jgi:hypothetical protein
MGFTGEGALREAIVSDVMIACDSGGLKVLIDE